MSDLLTQSAAALIGGTATVLVLYALAKGLQLWRIGHPFNLRRSIDAYRFDTTEQRRRKHTRHIHIPTGTSEVLLRVMPNMGTRVERIGVRFVKRHWPLFFNSPHLEIHTKLGYLWPRFWTWKNADASVVLIKNLKDKDFCEIGHKIGVRFTDWPDAVGGRWGDYSPAYLRTVDDSLWLLVTFEAKEPWKGHLSFQGHVAEAHRGYSRRSVTVTAAPSATPTSSSPPAPGPTSILSF